MTTWNEIRDENMGTFIQEISLESKSLEFSIPYDSLKHILVSNNKFSINITFKLWLERQRVVGCLATFGKQRLRSLKSCPLQLAFQIPVTIGRILLRNVMIRFY